MCGILGTYHYRSSLDGEVCRKFERGLGDMRGRGPDGYWVYADQGILMAQTLLQITDPEGKIRPYVSNDLNIIAGANGEIYNTQELRKTLENLGAIFQSESDCEVIAHGYALWKEGLFERLDGMFAIAIFDRRTRVLTLARDKVGIRPLYYSVQNNRVSFASEPRLLTESGFVPSTPSEEGLFHSLVLRRPIEPLTMYREVQAVLPGQMLSFGLDQRTERFFAHVPQQSPLAQTISSPHAVAERLKKTVADSVECRIPSRCDYSLFLSGGLDSTIVNRLAPQDSHRLPSLVCGFSFSDMVDEREMARKAAEQVETRLLTHSLGLEQFVELWPLMVGMNSEPLMFNSSIPLFLLCREARRMGAKVMLSGEGADELFVGYSQYPAYQKFQDDGSPGFLLAHDEEVIPPDLVLSQWVSDPRWGESQWSQLQDRIESICPFRGAEHGLNRKLEFDRMTFMRGLLMRQDRVGLNASMEIRVPFLDSSIYQEAVHSPLEWHLKNGTGKRLLRQAFAPTIGHELANTPKVGFPVPLNTWLQDSTFKTLCLELNTFLNTTGLIQKDAILSIMSSQSSYPRNSYRQIWTLLNLAMWWRGNTTDHLTPYAKKIADETRHVFAPEGLIHSVPSQNFPVVIQAKGWKNAQMVPLNELFSCEQNNPRKDH